MVRLSSLFLAAYFFAAVVFFTTIGLPALDREIDLQFYADSLTYENASQEEWFFDSLGVFGRNYLGPLMILRASASNRWLVMTLNMLLFVLGYAFLVKARRLNRLLLLLVLFLNPITFSSLLAVNKEIISYVFICLLAYGLHTGSKYALWAAVLISTLARWQLTVFALVYLAMTARVNPLRSRPLISLLLLLTGLSLIYPLMLDVFSAHHDAAALDGIIDESAFGTGLYRQMIAIQVAGGYILVAIPKALHVMFALATRIDRVFEWSSFYNNFVVTLHAAALLGVFLAVCATRRFTLKNPLVYASLVYIAIFALTPIYAPRYFYPVFILWAVVLASPRIRAEVPISQEYKTIGKTDVG